jgi:hypothetical protein
MGLPAYEEPKFAHRQQLGMHRWIALGDFQMAVDFGWNLPNSQWHPPIFAGRETNLLRRYCRRSQ